MQDEEVIFGLVMSESDANNSSEEHSKVQNIVMRIASRPNVQLVAFKKKSRKKKKNKNKRGKGGARKLQNLSRKKKGETGSSSSEDVDNNLVMINTKRKKTVNTFGTARKRNRPALSESLVQVSDRSAMAVQNSGGATATAEFDTAPANDARAIRERNIELNESGVTDDASLYRGQAGYKNYIKKDKQQLAANKFTGTQGPIRPSVFFRPSFRMDYQPDVCKDYKETGYCGYGASCKFLHDRGNYKQGWQIEQEWQAQEKKRQAKLNGEEIEDDPDFTAKEQNDSLPFACMICRKPFSVRLPSF